VSLAEEFEQLDDEKQGDSPPVVLHLQPQSNDETSLDQSPVHSSHQDNGPLVGERTSGWSPLVNQSPLQSPSRSNSHGPSPSPYLESSDSSRESPIPTSHEQSPRLYRTRDHKWKPTRSHYQQGNQLGRSDDQQHGLHDQQYGSRDEQYGSHDQVIYRSRDQTKGSLEVPVTPNHLYATPESFSCPNLSSLQAYESQYHHGKNDSGMSAIWDDHHHDNCASMDSIHLKSLSGQQQHTPLARRSTIITTTALPALQEETTPSPPSHVFKVRIGVASNISCCYDNR